MTLTWLLSVDTTRAPSPGPELRAGSTSIPSRPSPASAAARTSALCSPTPAVKTTASTRPSTA